MAFEKILEKIGTMQSLFEEYGFKNVRLFKGFGEGEAKKSFNLVVSFESNESWMSDVQKKSSLAAALTEMLGWQAYISFDTEIGRNYLNFINGSNGSVNLSNADLSTAAGREVLRAEFESCFEKDWNFTQVQSNVTQVESNKNLTNPPKSSFGSVLHQRSSNEEDANKVKATLNQLNDIVAQAQLTPNEIENLIQSFISSLNTLKLSGNR